MNQGITVLSGAGRRRGVNIQVPDWIAYSGDYVVRFEIFGGKTYAVYELRSSGTLSVAKPTAFDFYLVGPGGRGGVGTFYDVEGETQSFPAGPGGSGYPLTVLGQTVDGTCAVQIGTTTFQYPVTSYPTTLTLGTTTHTANYGGDGSVTSGGVARQGTGFIGTYYLFDDEAHPVGVSAPWSPNGCSKLSLVRGIRNSDRISNPLGGGIGYGAGGAGGSYWWEVNKWIQNFPNSGAQGVVIARVLLDKTGGSVAAAGVMDISFETGVMAFYPAEGYTGPIPYLDARGRLVLDVEEG